MDKPILKEIRASVIENPKMTREMLAAKFGIASQGTSRFTQSAGLILPPGKYQRYYYLDDTIEVQGIDGDMLIGLNHSQKLEKLIEMGYNDISICLHLNILIDTVYRAKGQLGKPSPDANVRKIEALKKLPERVEGKYHIFNIDVGIETDKYPSVMRYYGVHPEDKPFITHDIIVARIRKMIQHEVNHQVEYCVDHDPKYKPKNPVDAQYFPPDDQR